LLLSFPSPWHLFMKGHLYFSKPLLFLLFCGIESWQRVSVGF
jgi:hypothetical protein